MWGQRGCLHSNWWRVASMYLSLSCARAIADVAALARDRPSMLGREQAPMQALRFRGAALRVRGGGNFGRRKADTTDELMT